MLAGRRGKVGDDPQRTKRAKGAFTGVPEVCRLRRASALAPGSDALPLLLESGGS